jgi:hypothetical protein
LGAGCRYQHRQVRLAALREVLTMHGRLAEPACSVLLCLPKSCMAPMRMSPLQRIHKVQKACAPMRLCFACLPQLHIDAAPRC